MMVAAGRSLMTDRLGDLERTVDSLNGQLREVQWELHQTKVEPLAIRLWRTLLPHKGGGLFMSAVCNRRIRPNTKVVSHDCSRAAR
jgi:hypothetical protein